MQVLLLGGGGREHALARGIAASVKLSRFWAAPGSDAIGVMAERVALDIENGPAVAEFAQRNAVDLVVIGPEAPLAAGVADALEAAGVAVFGPSQAAARLESSKSFTKEICDAVGAPTAAWARCDTLETARAALARFGAPVVVKADGLAAGKGVTVATTPEQADAAARAIFAEPGGVAVVEEFMQGEEASLFVLCDGETALPFGGAQDHKRAFDGDEGPNTGGMGAYSPAPVLTPGIEADAMARIIRPVLAEMARRGTPFRGVLYAGLMIHDGRARLVEFNTRFGDPEAQVLIPRLESDLLDLLHRAATGGLADAKPVWGDGAAAAVVLAARGYPGGYRKGEEIRGLDAAAAVSGAHVIHAGLAHREGMWLSNGGRALSVVGTGATLEEAVARAYLAAEKIDWPGGFMRRDIGWRALGGAAAP